ncbi:MAG TPA: orotidine-5'-phosphate decarboxylase [Dehalococcoidales bacterium]|nr:orotidine-5'-phosphate decarboxylase [Dehalococcoidales bacterium]
MNFNEKLKRAVQKNRSLVCVGLDPDPGLMPAKVSISEFNQAIIEATSDLVCAYKPNLAFYEAAGEEGMEALKKTVKAIPAEIPVIADGKRGDIGNTSKAYARALFEVFGFDAATVNPYLGSDAVEPFIQFSEKGIFILCRTSNAGARDFQSLSCLTDQGPRPLFEIVAEKAREWNKSGNVGLVVGATYPDELKTIRRMLPDMPFLIPGIGAQGGEVEITVKNGVSLQGDKAIINSSRQILYASKGLDFAEAARRATETLRDVINQYRKIQVVDSDGAGTETG